MKPAKILILPLAFILLISISACQKPADKAVIKEKRLRIITTIPPLYSFTKNIVGNLADVENLLPSGVGPHEYSFKPNDVKRVADARMLIKNGAGLENWLDGMIDLTGAGSLKVIDTSIGVDVINNDPHIWISPKNAMVQVKNITDALIKADPDNGKAYRKNSEDYIAKLKLLDEEISSAASGWSKKDFVSLHSAFLYFAKDYGLRQVGVIIESPDKIPTPGHLKDIMGKIRAAGIKAIFSEPGPHPKAVMMIAKELGVEIYRLDTMEAGDLSSGWYEEKTRANLLVMKMAFDQYYGVSKGNSK
ncbi:MAG: zinc ABC transporter substrate-binding protein [Thermodesulfovibrionia bacterium]|nr:zinc ABC transporter substrate-binding protein [Thermodesulfovibrionia bacterium]